MSFTQTWVGRRNHSRVWMMDHAAPLHFGVKKEKVGALTILTPSLRQSLNHEVKAIRAN